MSKYSSLANFRRPRRASQDQRRAARQLGRRRRGRSRNQWKGIALAGGAIVGVGAIAAASRQGSGSTAPPPAPPPASSSAAAPRASPASTATRSPGGVDASQEGLSGTNSPSQVSPSDDSRPLTSASENVTARQSTRLTKKQKKTKRRNLGLTNKEINTNKVKGRLHKLQKMAWGNDKRSSQEPRVSNNAPGLKLTPGAERQLRKTRNYQMRKEIIDAERKGEWKRGVYPAAEFNYPRRSAITDSTQGDTSMYYYYPPTAEFRRPRRASQAQRKAARDLGRRRRGRSRDQWKGLALAGAGAAAAAGVGALALRGRGIRSGDPSKGIGGSLESARAGTSRAVRSAGSRVGEAGRRVGAGVGEAGRNVGAGAASLIPPRGARRGNAEPWATNPPNFDGSPAAAAAAPAAAPAYQAASKTRVSSQGKRTRKRVTRSPRSPQPSASGHNRDALINRLNRYSRSYEAANFSTTPDGRRVISLNIRRPIGSYYY